MECLVKADPLTPTEYLWLKNGQLHSQGDAKFKLIENGRKVQILFANEDDAGLYSCLAKNRAGEIKKDYKLVVKSKEGNNLGKRFNDFLQFLRPSNLNRKNSKLLKTGLWFFPATFLEPHSLKLNG